jgi:hypothetical protein
MEITSMSQKMKLTAPACWSVVLVAISLLLFSGSLAAEEFEWETIGKIKLNSAKDWTVAEKVQGAEGYHVRLLAPPPRKAALLLTFMVLPKPVKGEEAKLEMLNRSFDAVLPQSVEGKADVKSLGLPSPFVSGYAQFTDKDLVGKDRGDHQYLLLRVGQVWFDHQILVQLTMFFDSESQPEVKEMMEMAQSVRVVQQL